MGEKLSCDIVRDLLPNYVENLTSEKTNQSIREHLEGCEDCTEELQEMKQEITTFAVKNKKEAKEFKGFLKYKKMQILSTVLYASGLLGILVCLIVNLAIDRGLTWSPIVIGGIAVVLIPYYIGVNGKRAKLEKAFLSLIVLLFPYLKLIESVVNKYFLPKPYDWFYTLGMPMVIFWALILIIIYYLRKWLKLNVYFTLGAFLVLGGAGSILTNYYVSVVTGSPRSMVDALINGLSCGITAVICIALGIGKEKRDRSN